MLVAPLAGSVDRNCMVSPYNKVPHVAPLAGSVDRNAMEKPASLQNVLSLPSRGAWIEIASTTYWTPQAGRRSPRGERG